MDNLENYFSTLFGNVIKVKQGLCLAQLFQK